MKYFIVKESVNNNEMKFGCFIEIRVKERKLVIILSLVFKYWLSIINYEYS